MLPLCKIKVSVKLVSELVYRQASSVDPKAGTMPTLLRQETMVLLQP